jgi:hypothetical protein
VITDVHSAYFNVVEGANIIIEYRGSQNGHRVDRVLRGGLGDPNMYRCSTPNRLRSASCCRNR